jgi:transcription antitermination factor NusG
MPNAPNHYKWYVIYTYPNSEKKIYHELIRRAISVFLPTRYIIRQWSDRKKSVEVPLFPNYLFVNVHPQQMWEVLMVSGVVRYITLNGAPVVVKDGDIAYVRQLLLGTNVLNNTALGLQGHKVQVTRGPLSGLVGKVTDLKGKTRLFVELEAIQQAISIEIDASLLAIVD